MNINPQEITFWTDLFANCFLCDELSGGPDAVKNSLTHDDMLFFVSKLDPQQVGFLFWNHMDHERVNLK